MELDINIFSIIREYKIIFLSYYTNLYSCQLVWFIFWRTDKVVSTVAAF